ncbi:hypothetical protein [Chloroflexus sp.]|uniref:hypothetical protein n=1 Tax=Chloroflexus sp. TaxID=1904827 RepID=UPI0026361551|nr:hypothetical protein [uncultured Chloroflexus sp.]
MNRFEEENPTVNWLPGFVRRWFGLTNENPRARAGSQYQWMPGWLKQLLNLDEPTPYPAEPGAPPAAAPSRPTYTPPPRSYTPGPATFTPTSRSFNPSSYQPASETAPSSPARSSLSGDELPADVQPIGYLLHSYARGALPPQGLEAFTREVRTTTEKVFNFYGHWLRFQTEELLRIAGDLGKAVVEALPGENPKPSSPTIRRIKVVADNGNGPQAERSASVSPQPAAAVAAPEVAPEGATGTPADSSPASTEPERNE